MIRKLRRKFVAAAIVSVFLVLFLLIGAINLINYQRLVADADQTLAILSANRGSFPGEMLRDEDRPELPPAMPDEGMLPPTPGTALFCA